MVHLPQADDTTEVTDESLVGGQTLRLAPLMEWKSHQNPRGPGCLFRLVRPVSLRHEQEPLLEKRSPRTCIATKVD